MKTKFIYLIMPMLLFVTSCSDNDDDQLEDNVAVVEVKVAGITDNKMTIIETDSIQLSAQVVLSNGVISDNWSPNDMRILTMTSSDTKTVRISDTGKLYGIKVGTASIHVTYAYNNGYFDSIFDQEFPSVTVDVTVEQNPVTQIVLAEQYKEFVLEGTFDLSSVLTVYPENATYQTVEYKSSDESIAVVDENGIIKAVGFGKAKITATSTDGTNISDEFEVEVDGYPVKSITLGEEQTYLRDGKKANITDIVSVAIAPADAKYKDLEYTSSNTTVATIDADGKVVALIPGETDITLYATDGSGVTATLKLVVTYKDFQAWGTAWHVGGTYNLVERYQLPPDVDIADVTYTSSNPNIVTVNENGLVTCVSVGEAIITIESKNGEVTGDSKVIVREATKVITQIKYGAGINSSIGISMSVNGTINPTKGNTPIRAYDKTINNYATTILRYDFKNPAIARDNGDGTITALKKGNCAVTVYSTDGSGISFAAKITVN